MTRPDPNEVLSVSQVMRELGVCRNTVYARIHDKTLRATKRGKLFYIRRAWLEEFLAAEDIPA